MDTSCLTVSGITPINRDGSLHFNFSIVYDESLLTLIVQWLSSFVVDNEVCKKSQHTIDASSQTRTYRSSGTQLELLRQWHLILFIDIEQCLTEPDFDVMHNITNILEWCG